MQSTQLYYRLAVHPGVRVHSVQTGEFFSPAGGCCTTSYYEYGKLQTEAEPVSKTRGPKTNWFGRNKFPRPDSEHYFEGPSTVPSPCRE